MQTGKSNKFIDSFLTEIFSEESPSLTSSNINISLLAYKIIDDTVEKLYQEDLKAEEAEYYAASLIKLFNALRAQEKLSDLAKENSEQYDLQYKDIDDAIYESLKSSDNDALSLLVDFNTETSSGPKLYGAAFDEFKRARETINNYFRQRANYSKQFNIANKCFSFAPYGRDKDLVFSLQGSGRNILTAEDVAEIMLDIRNNSPDLLNYMQRDIGDDLDEQCQFIARGLQKCKHQITEYYSKAGWTSKVRHDTALIRFEDGTEYLMVIMTQGLSHCEDLIPAIAGKIMAILRAS